jgi:hypothetical protein
MFPNEQRLEAEQAMFARASEGVWSKFVRCQKFPHQHAHRIF